MLAVHVYWAESSFGGFTRGGREIIHVNILTQIVANVGLSAG